jgi:hypothetical protein
MILDQTIGSARAEKHKNPVANRIVRNLLTAFLASALTLPSLARHPHLGGLPHRRVIRCVAF